MLQNIEKLFLASNTGECDFHIPLSIVQHKSLHAQRNHFFFLMQTPLNSINRNHNQYHNITEYLMEFIRIKYKLKVKIK